MFHFSPLQLFVLKLHQRDYTCKKQIYINIFLIMYNCIAEKN